MAKGVIQRYEQAGEAAPELMYVDRGCCRERGSTSTEILFEEWVGSGMLIRLDAWHWMHRFDCAVRTDSHPKFAVFKSALAGALFAYNKSDMELLVKAVRAGSENGYNDKTDADIIQQHISNETIKHHVRRITQGNMETFRLVEHAIEVLKGDAGLDENGIPLFKSNDAIDEIWMCQQRHLECIQDPPEMSMYRIAKLSVKNGIQIPYYTCVRGNNSLEGFHNHLPKMIPG